MSKEWINGCGTGLREFLADYFSGATGRKLSSADIDTCVSTRQEDGETRHFVEFDPQNRFALLQRPGNFRLGYFPGKRSVMAFAAKPEAAWHQFFLEKPYQLTDDRRAGGCDALLESGNTEHFVAADGFVDVIIPADVPADIPDFPPEPDPVPDTHVTDVPVDAEPDPGPELPVDVAPEAEPEEVVEPAGEVVEPDGQVEPEPEFVEPDAQPEPDLSTDADADVQDEVEPPLDTDNDGILDDKDNCPNHFNPIQTDTDKNDIGDACEQCITFTCESAESTDSCEDAAPESKNTGVLGEHCSAGIGVCENTATTTCVLVNEDADDAQAEYQVICPAQSGAKQPVELCNGVDDDCDTETDETFKNPLSGLGTSCHVGVGACLVQGALICNTNGDGMECDVTPGMPTQEICNAIDDDCDGFVDEQNLFPKAPLYLACEGPTEGECFPGIRVCKDGKFGDCEGVFTPEEECNGLDDNCNGVTDEGTFGDCTVGAGFCVSQGAFICTDANLQCNAPVITPADLSAELGILKFCEYNEAGEGCDETPPLYYTDILDSATGDTLTADAFLDNSSHKTICFLNNCVEECVEFIPQELWFQGLIMNWDAVPNGLGVTLAKVSGAGGSTSLKIVIGGEILYGLQSNGCDGSQYLDCPAQP